MRYVFLDGEKLLTPEDLHRAFADALDFPAYYGSNLDALRDCLTDLPDPVSVIAVNTEALKAHMGRKWRGFCRLRAGLPEEKPDFRYWPEPFGDMAKEAHLLEQEEQP